MLQNYRMFPNVRRFTHVVAVFGFVAFMAHLHSLKTFRAAKFEHHALTGSSVHSR